MHKTESILKNYWNVILLLIFSCQKTKFHENTRVIKDGNLALISRNKKKSFAAILACEVELRKYFSKLTHN